jgi:hypothetical protein
MLPSTAQPHRPRDLSRRLSAFGTSFALSRGSRFARCNEVVVETKLLPTFADMINLPDWILCEDVIVGDIAAVTALLHFRYAIDRELSGTRLRAICECVGEGNYDLACEAPIPTLELIADAETKLPSPDQLRAIGQTMLDRALPVTMASTISEACGDINMRQLSNIATALVTAHRGASVEPVA